MEQPNNTTKLGDLNPGDTFTLESEPGIWHLTGNVRIRSTKGRVKHVGAEARVYVVSDAGTKRKAEKVREQLKNWQSVIAASYVCLRSDDPRLTNATETKRFSEVLDESAQRAEDKSIEAVRGIEAKIKELRLAHDGSVGTAMLGTVLATGAACDGNYPFVIGLGLLSILIAFAACWRVRDIEKVLRGVE